MIATDLLPKIDPVLANWFISLPESQQNSFLADIAGNLESVADNKRFEPYQFEPLAYMEKFLDARPWQKQIEPIEAYRKALLQQHEQRKFENGQPYDVATWQPGQTIQNWISVDAGVTVGKTWLGAKIVSHFFDCFWPSIGYCFAPNTTQIDDLLFKEIRVDRQGRSNLRGEVMLEARIKYKANHFVKGKATKDAKDTGIENTQGQHAPYMIFVCDEADGIYQDFIWTAIERMASGGICIVLVLRNPRLTDSRAHLIRDAAHTAAMTISELDHPNVLDDRDVIPGAVRRQFVLDMLKTCERVEAHNPDRYTFELPWQPGIIYEPSPDFCTAVLGIASGFEAGDTFCPTGRFDAAKERPKPLVNADPTKARIGVDVARYGDDVGTEYLCWRGELSRRNQFAQQDYYKYYLSIKDDVRWLVSEGVTDIEIRVDAGGGYGGGVVSWLENDADLNELDEDGKRQGDFAGLEELRIIEVDFGSTITYDSDKFYDMATEMYYHTGEAMKVLRLIDPPRTLQSDLCRRKYRYRKKDGKDVKVLVGKDDFKKKFRRSPDDGDGAVLAAAPDYIFTGSVLIGWV